MIEYRLFIERLRSVELEVPYVVLNENISPKLYEYISALHNTAFVDGSYHTYCGEIKFLINHFINYWMEIINNAVREADRCINIITKDELLHLIDKSINIHQIRQVAFAKAFLPITSDEEKQRFIGIQEKFEKFMDKLFATREMVDKFDKYEEVIAFTKNNFDISIQRKAALLDFTHSYVALTLADHNYKVRTSIEECLLRVRNNLREMEAERDDILNNLMYELYDRNKERLTLSRKDRRSSADVAEVDFTISKLRDKIEDYHMTTPIPRLEDEVRYWERRLKEYNRVESTLFKLKEAKKHLLAQEEIYKTYKDHVPPSKFKCWENLEENIIKRKEFIEKKYLDAARALLTFFGVRGQNRVFYRDNIGQYCLDDYGHQIYYFDLGKTICHVTCDGSFKEVKEMDKYYYDRSGRYVMDKNNEKVYQVAACTSCYKLGKDDLLVKTTKDCGHSEKVNKECKMQLKDPNMREILPRTDITDIRRTLDADVVKYLWDCFGHVLPESLRDVGEARLNNPIHHLAHRLLFYKYGKTRDATKEAIKVANTYRANVFQTRLEKAIAQSKAWKAKQIKRRKPEESDDLMERMIYDAYIGQCKFINSLNYFDD